VTQILYLSLRQSHVSRINIDISGSNDCMSLEVYVVKKPEDYCDAVG